MLLRAENLWGNNAYLPFGLLREDPERIKHAHLIVIHGVKNREQSQESMQEVQKRIGEKPMITTKYVVENAQELAGRKIGAFCGIGNPDSFFQLLHDIKCDIIHQRRLMDHAKMQSQTLRRFITECRKEGAEYVVCTEKDRIKYPQIGRELQPLRVRMEIVEGQKTFNSAIKAIRRLISSN